MCGIAGIVNLKDPQPVSVSVLSAMAEAIRHRGPDEFGMYRDDWVGLASARLSIVDLRNGQQPIGNEDGTLWIVFNGEIFNYLELRSELESRGHRFATESDTEVILHLFEDGGPNCLQRLNGQFALALWNVRNHSLFIARDRLGIRPLYYTQRPGQLIFASEMKAILAAPDIRAEIDPVALRQAFTFWSPQSPRSIFRGIAELPPGHFLVACEGEIATQSYWQLEFTEDTPRRNQDDYLDELESLLIDATQVRLRADVPVGAYVSGGLDSSIVAALARKYTDRYLDTFAIAFSDPAFDESPFQRQMAEFLGTRHQEVLCTYEDIGRVFPDVIWHTETPVLRTAPAPMFLLSELVHRQGYKVVLTGEGADEFLAGYDLFKEMQIRRFWARNPASALRPALFRKLYPDIPELAKNGTFRTAFFAQDLQNTSSPSYSHHIRWRNTARALRFLLSEGGTQSRNPDETAYPGQLPAEFCQWPALAQAQYLEITTFLSSYLLSSQGDRVAMAHSVEGRYPFLDYRVVEFCNRLPADLKLRGLREKWLLRQLGRKLVPSEIWQRGKRPYRAPIQRCFFTQGSGLEYVRELLAPASIRRTGYFRPDAVERLVNKARGPAELSEVDEMALVGILSTQLMDRLFVRVTRPRPTHLDLAQWKIVDRVSVRVQTYA